MMKIRLKLRDYRDIVGEYIYPNDQFPNYKLVLRNPDLKNNTIEFTVDDREPTIHSVTNWHVVELDEIMKDIAEGKYIRYSP